MLMKQKVKRNKTSGSGSVIKTILREELKNFATKDDLKNFATKDDLKNFATKDDLKNFATKDDLSDFKIEIFAEISKAELKTLDREQAYHSDVMTQFDKIMKKLETMREESEIDNFQRDEKIENHEKRIKRLEIAQ